MKISAVFLKKPKRKKLRINASETDKSLLIIFLTILLSIICGAMAYIFNRDAFGGELWNAFVSYLTNRGGKTFAELFSGLYIINLFTLILLSIFGTSSFGLIPTLTTVIARTLGIGTIGAYLFMCYSFTGLKYYYMVILPGKVLMLFGLLLAAQNSIQTSRRINQALDGKTGENVDKRMYTIRSLVCAIIFAVSALIDTLLIIFASEKFIF